MTVLLFWGAAALIVYTYLLFPLLVALRGAVRPRPWRQEEITPSVSLIIAAHNEVDVIEEKINNLLSLDYPEDCLEIIIASDGSDDGTNEVVARYEALNEGRGVRLLALPRNGKAVALNSAVAAASGDILVFSDANSIFAPDALRHITRSFADSEVGGVAGDQHYRLPEGVDLTGQGEKQYWSLDRRLKILESLGGNAISATGAIYAVRRSLFQPIPDGVTDDFYNSTGVIEQGYRLVFEPKAIAYETVSSSGQKQFQRKVRIITRGLTAVSMRRGLLNPLRHGFYAVQLFSHKVLRRLVVFPLAALFAVSLALVRRHPFYRLAALAQLAFYGTAAAGYILEKRNLENRISKFPIPISKLFSLPTYFCTVNLAALVAAINLLRGRRIVVWDTEERAS